MEHEATSAALDELHVRQLHQSATTPVPASSDDGVEQEADRGSVRDRRIACGVRRLRQSHRAAPWRSRATNSLAPGLPELSLEIFGVTGSAVGALRDIRAVDKMGHCRRVGRIDIFGRPEPGIGAAARSRRVSGAIAMGEKRAR
jgi:hypothetical protein